MIEASPHAKIGPIVVTHGVVATAGAVIIVIGVAIAIRCRTRRSTPATLSTADRFRYRAWISFAAIGVGPLVFGLDREINLDLLGPTVVVMMLLVLLWLCLLVHASDLIRARQRESEGAANAP